MSLQAASQQAGTLTCSLLVVPMLPLDVMAVFVVVVAIRVVEVGFVAQVVRIVDGIIILIIGMVVLKVVVPVKIRPLQASHHNQMLRLVAARLSADFIKRKGGACAAGPCHCVRVLGV